MDLPDNVWLKIMSYLTSDNLIIFTNLSDADRSKSSFNSRLYQLCGDKSLWTNIIYEGNRKPNDLRKIVKFLGKFI